MKTDINRPKLKKEYIESGIALFGQLPVVSIGNEHLVQTNAILRYFARAHDLYGNTNEQMYLADMVADGVDDWRSGYTPLVYSKEFDAKVATYVQEKIPSTLRTFETILRVKSSGKPLFVRSDKPTYADYLVLDMLTLLLRLDGQALDEHDTPLLKKFYETMTSRKGIDAYLKSGRRPQNANNSKNG